MASRKINMEAPGQVPRYASRILGSIEREAPDGTRYLFEMLRILDPAVSVCSRLRIFFSNETSGWRLMSMRLNLRSRFYVLATTSWPPETLDDVSFANGVILRFHDRANGHGPNARPDFFTESEWEARFDRSKQLWSIRRLRRIGERDWPTMTTLFENE